MCQFDHPIRVLIELSPCTSAVLGSLGPSRVSTALRLPHPRLPLALSAESDGGETSAGGAGGYSAGDLGNGEYELKERIISGDAVLHRCDGP